eukprot:scaffold81003_cov17-Prasinocladus_malaysianus.AAC.2
MALSDSSKCCSLKSLFHERSKAQHAHSPGISSARWNILNYPPDILPEFATPAVDGPVGSLKRTELNDEHACSHDVCSCVPVPMRMS